MKNKSVETARAVHEGDALPAGPQAEDADTHSFGAINHSFNCRVQARHIAAAGEHS